MDIFDKFVCTALALNYDRMMRDILECSSIKSKQCKRRRSLGLREFRRGDQIWGVSTRRNAYEQIVCGNEIFKLPRERTIVPFVVR
jgi:hypothetical protein